MLINKGKFRERANRSKYYNTSENKVAQLNEHGYTNNAEKPHLTAQNHDQTTMVTKNQSTTD